MENPLRRGGATYAKWLAWCEDDRTTGSMLSTKIPCTLHFLVAEDDGELLGAIVINHGSTHRGHLHAGIAPWNRSRGYGRLMLSLALEECRRRGMSEVEIVPYKENHSAIATISANGGRAVGEFTQDGRASVRYSIDLRQR